MKKEYKFFCLKLLILIFLFKQCDSKLPDVKRCGNPECSKPISKGTTINIYNRNEDYMISFKSSLEVNIYSMTNDLYEIEINGVRGFAPKQFVKENKVLIRKELLVDVKTDVDLYIQNQSTKREIDKVELEVNDTAIENRDGNGNNETEIQSDQSSNDNSNIIEKNIALSENDTLNQNSKTKESQTQIYTDIEPETKDSSSNLESKSLDSLDDKNHGGEDTSEEIEKDIKESTKEKLIEGNTEDSNKIEYSETNLNIETPKNEEKSIHEAAHSSSPQNITDIINKVPSTSTIEKDDIKTNTEEQGNIDVKTVQNTDNTKQLDKSILENPISSSNNFNHEAAHSSSPKIITEIINKAPVTSAIEKDDFKTNLEKLGNIDVKTVQNTDNTEHFDQNKENLISSSNNKTSNDTIHDNMKEDGFKKNSQTTETVNNNFKLEEVLEDTSTEAEELNDNTNHSKFAETEIKTEDHIDKNTNDEIVSNSSDTIVGSFDSAKFNHNSKSINRISTVNLNEVPENTFQNVSNEENALDPPSDQMFKQNTNTDAQNNELGLNDLNNLDPASVQMLELNQNTNTDAENNEFTESKDLKTKIEKTTEPTIIQKLQLSTENDMRETLSTPQFVSPDAEEQEKLKTAVFERNNNKGVSAGVVSNIVNMIFGNNEDDSKESIENKNIPIDEEMQRILFPDKKLDIVEKDKIANDGFCENLSSNSCPKSTKENIHHDELKTKSNVEQIPIFNNGDYDKYVEIILDKVIEMRDLILYLSITAVTLLSFIFGHYCIDKSRKESPLLKNLNLLERNLMVCKKECDLAQGALEDTRAKLTSIEDNSFGSNEMVISLKRQLDEKETMAKDYQTQILSLEKELENAAEAGLELNRMVSELLNNQSGSDSIISSVEELQKQLNEQQETIFSINATLAEKSRENSELQILINDQKLQYEEHINELQKTNESMEENSLHLQNELLELKNNLEVKLSDINKEHVIQITKLSNEISSLERLHEEVQKKLNKSEANVQTLKEYLSNLKKDKNEFNEILDVVNIKSDLVATIREKEKLKEMFEREIDTKKSLEQHVKVLSKEFSILKQEYSTAEKEKVESQTRLEVLSGYFKEKETQLQKELSIKEAMWMQSQGETTSTVERVRAMQDEIQTLKSQNDSLRVEIEAQSTAHKTQITAVESRAHEAWLSARKAERKLEETRVEAAGLRRKLTSLGDNVSDLNLQNRGLNSVDGLNEMNAPSPIHMVDNPGSPIMGVLPPPPFMPPFIAPPPPPHAFMPPPFMPGEMRPPPLGRLMSPPPNRYSPNILDDRNRYSPDRDHRGRSYSSDGRDYYDGMSPYDTETDFCPPSPGPPRHGYRDNHRGYKAYSPPPPDSRIKQSTGDLS